MPAAAIAFGVRLVAVHFSEQYFSWVEFFSEVGGDPWNDSQQRRVALARRLLVPFVVMFVLVLAIPARYDLTGGALVGALAALLVLWPMVFHGLPYGVRSSDWELVPIYSSFIALFAISGTLGAGGAQAIRETEAPIVYSVQTAGTIVLGVVAVGAFWSTYTWATARLGRRTSTRIYDAEDVVWEGEDDVSNEEPETGGPADDIVVEETDPTKGERE